MKNTCPSSAIGRILLVDYLVPTIHAGILIEAIIHARISGIALVVPLKKYSVSEIAIPLEILVASMITADAPIDHLVRAVHAQILVMSQITSMISSIALVVADKAQAVSNIAIAVMILVVLLEASVTGMASPPSPTCGSYMRGGRGQTRGRGERGQGHPWQKEQRKQCTQTDKAQPSFQNPPPFLHCTWKLKKR